MTKQMQFLSQADFNRLRHTPNRGEISSDSSSPFQDEQSGDQGAFDKVQRLEMLFKITMQDKGQQHAPDAPLAKLSSAGSSTRQLALRSPGGYAHVGAVPHSAEPKTTEGKRLRAGSFGLAIPEEPIRERCSCKRKTKTKAPTRSGLESMVQRTIRSSATSTGKEPHETYLSPSEYAISSFAENSDSWSEMTNIISEQAQEQQESSQMDNPLSQISVVEHNQQESSQTDGQVWGS